LILTLNVCAAFVPRWYRPESREAGATEDAVAAWLDTKQRSSCQPFWLRVTYSDRSPPAIEPCGREVADSGANSLLFTASGGTADKKQPVPSRTTIAGSHPRDAQGGTEHRLKLAICRRIGSGWRTRCRAEEARLSIPVTNRSPRHSSEDRRFLMRWPEPYARQ